MYLSALLKNKGLSLLEIIISALIIAVVLTGLVNMFFLGKKYIMHSRARMAGAELGKVFVEPLQLDVRQDQWNTGSGDYTNNLAMGSHSSTQTQNGITYTSTYNVALPPGFGAGSQARSVAANITWIENQP